MNNETRERNKIMRMHRRLIQRVGGQAAVHQKVSELIEKYSEQGNGHFDTAPGSPLHNELTEWLREGGRQ